MSMATVALCFPEAEPARPSHGRSGDAGDRVVDGVPVYAFIIRQA